MEKVYAASNDAPGESARIYDRPRKDNPVSQHSPDLVALLNRLHENDQLTRKAFAQAIDVSERTADRVFVDGWSDFENVQRAVRNLPLTVAFDLLTLIAGDRFEVKHRGAAAEGCEGVAGALKIAENGAELGLKIVQADADRIRTHEEAADIQARLNHIRRCCDAMEESNAKLTGRRAG
jgi:hypothetical protein